MFIISISLTMIGVKKTPAAYGNAPNRYPILAACTRFEYNLFRSVDFSVLGNANAVKAAPGDVEYWRNTFHTTVSSVVDEYFTPAKLECSGSSHAQAFPPRPILLKLANTLPSWRTLTWQLHNEKTSSNWWDIFSGGNVDWTQVNYNSLHLSELDIGTVLLEYLRMYECALVERTLFLPTHTLDQVSKREALLSGNILPTLEHMIVAVIVWTDRETIIEELLIARRAINRTVTMLSGYNRFNVLNMELQCLQQASLDMRNGLALAADSASCLPRIWNAKDPLRDYPKKK